MKIRLTTWTAALALTFLSSSGVLLAQMSSDISMYPTNAAAVLPGRGTVSKWAGLAPTWARRQGDFAKTAPNDHHAVVFLGDSITQGWKSLATDFPDLKVANRGISGDTTRGVLYRLDDNVLSLDPQAVVLLIGTNDLGAGGDPADAAYNIELILNQMHKKFPHMPIIVCEVMPSSEKQHRPPATIEKLNKLIKKDVRWHSQEYLCDTWTLFAQPDGDAPKDIFPDLLHPNADGYAKWVAVLKPIFVKAKIEMAE
jgi:lysophospholipase L1-like esterase